MKAQIKAAAKSRKTVTSGLWLTVLSAGLTALAAHWGSLQAVLPPQYWVLGTVGIAIATALLHHWQGAS